MKRKSYDLSYEYSENILIEEQRVDKLSWKTKLCYSFGHIFNDICAAFMVAYHLLYFKMQFQGIIAGGLFLVGQVADALATIFVGYHSDKTNGNHLFCKYGKRKTWHLLGTVLVAISYPFLYNQCFYCEYSSDIIRIIYYGFFMILFQIGWAAVQVQHLSLICDLSTDSNERVTLNAYRQAANLASSICVYTITWFALSKEGDYDSPLNKENLHIFTKVVYIVCSIGLFFSILFHIFVSEPKEWSNSSSPNQSVNGSTNDRHKYRKRVCSVFSIYEINIIKSDHILNKSMDGKFFRPEFECSQTYKWSDWLKLINFYKVAYIYMITRLFVNLTQFYTPLFLQNTLHLRKTSIAIIPFVTYISGFIWSIVSKYISVKTGPKILLLLGCALGLGSCYWNSFGTIDNQSFKQWQVYGSALLFGMGSTTMLIASLALTSDLIGSNNSSSAFVFGTMSFFDKVINGLIVVIVEQLNPYKDVVDEDFSIPFYRNIVVYVSGATTLLIIFGVLTIKKYF